MRKRKTWRAWTFAEIERLEQLTLDGHNVPEIAELMGRSRESIRDRIAYDGLSYVGVRARWIKLLSRPHKIADVAEAMGVSKHAVTQAKWNLRKMGLEVCAATVG